MNGQRKSKYKKVGDWPKEQSSTFVNVKKLTNGPMEQLDKTNSTAWKYNNKHCYTSILRHVAFVVVKMEAFSMGPWNCWHHVSASSRLKWPLSTNITINQILWQLKCNNDTVHQGERQKILEVSHLQEVVGGEEHRVYCFVRLQQKGLQKVDFHLTEPQIPQSSTSTNFLACNI